MTAEKEIRYKILDKRRKYKLCHNCGSEILNRCAMAKFCLDCFPIMRESQRLTVIVSKSLLSQ